MSGRHRADRERSAWRPLAAAAIGASVLVVAVNGAWAGLVARATNTTPQNVAAGTLHLTMTANGTGFSQSVANLAPGDTVRRYVDVANSGTLAADGLTLGVAATGSSTLLADTAAGTKALRLSISTCSGTWTPATGACSGTATQVLAATPLGSFPAPVTLVSGAVAAGQVHRLQVTLLLPDQTETTTNGVAPATTIQGQSVDVTYTFTEAQRAATTTTS
jgi:hypothetical protein